MTVSIWPVIAGTFLGGIVAACGVLRLLRRRDRGPAPAAPDTRALILRRLAPEDVAYLAKISDHMDHMEGESQ